MKILQDAANALKCIEAELREPAATGLDSARLADRIREVRSLLATQDIQWIGTTEAKRLLGVSSENTIKAWARVGLLRSRHLPNGRTQVLLDDVLRRKEETEGLSAIGGDELTGEELRGLRSGRPGTNPWERQSAQMPP
jgi:hypothetical protein